MYERELEENALLRKYYFMEYNLLKGGKDYRAELFETGGASD